MTKIRFDGLNAVNMGVGIVLNINIPMTYRNAVQAILDGFKAGKEYEIKPYKPKKSVTANGYMWVLADLLAQKLNSTPEEIYREAISYVGVFEEIRIEDKEAQKRFKKIWRSNGIGWLTKTISDDTILAYYGSSTYDSEQLARLIDFLVVECKRQNIEVRPREEIESMLKTWGER